MWNKSCGEARTILHEKWDYPNGRPSKFLMTVHITTGEAQEFSETIVLYGYNFENVSNYITFCGQTKHVLSVRGCSAPTTVVSGNGIILMQCAKEDIKSASS
jgi:hypothetical protein